MFAFIEENLGAILIICCIFEVIRLHAHFTNTPINMIIKGIGSRALIIRPILTPRWYNVVFCVGIIFDILYLMLLYMGIRIALVFIGVRIIEHFIPSPSYYVRGTLTRVCNTLDALNSRYSISQDLLGSGNTMNLNFAPDVAAEMKMQLIDAKLMMEMLLSHMNGTDENRDIEKQSWYLKIWHGDYSLPRAFWLNFLLVDAVFSLVCGFLDGALGLESAYMLPVSWISICSLLSCLWTVFAGVGVCRSAKKYKGFVLWAYLACAFVVICFAEVVIIMVKRVFA